MERLIDWIEGMMDIVEQTENKVTVEYAGKRFYITCSPVGAYQVEDEDGKKKHFSTPEASVIDYIVQSACEDDRDIFVRMVKRFLLIGHEPRTICGSFDTKEEAQARADEINGYGAEEGDEPTEFKIIDLGE